MANTQLVLEQTKVYVGPLRFGVRHRVISASPGILRTPLIVDLSYAPFDKEKLLHVATLAEIVEMRLPDTTPLAIKRLNVFCDDSVEMPAVETGDTLEVDDPPAEWGLTTPAVFNVVGLDGGGLKIEGQFWWSVANPGDYNGLQWRLVRAGNAVASGLKGWTRREGGDGPCLVDQFMAVFPDGETALNHLISVQTYVRSLANSAGLFGTEFEQYPPGNPVTTTFPE